MPEPGETDSTTRTPILDSGVLPQPVSRRWRTNKARGVIGFIIGIVVVLPVIAWTDKSRDAKSGPILLLVALAATITVHEIGHLLAGWMVGFRFSYVHIGPLSLSFEHGRLKLRARREMLALGLAGMHTGTVRRLRRRLLIYVAGGPGANILSIPATVLLVNYVSPGLAETRTGVLASQFAVFSLLAALTSLMPIRSALFSDGARIEMLLRSFDRSRRWLSISALTNLHDNGIRPRNWRRTWLQSAASVHDGSFDAFAGDWLAYMSANDRKDASVATIHLERCLALAPVLPPSLRDFVAQEAVVFSAWFRDDALLADRWLTQLKKSGTMQRLVQIRLNVALGCAHRDYDAADLSWREGLRFIENSTSGTARERLEESWLEWQAEIRERKRQPSAVLNEVF